MHCSPTGHHFGNIKTIRKVREWFYWNKVNDDVEKWCKTGDARGASKEPKSRNWEKLQCYIIGAHFETIAFDILGSLRRSNDGDKYILIIMDYFTKWPEAYPTSTVTEVLLQNWILRYAVPHHPHSDEGNNFTSTVFKPLCELLKIDKIQTTSLQLLSNHMVK